MSMAGEDEWGVLSFSEVMARKRDRQREPTAARGNEPRPSRSPAPSRRRDGTSGGGGGGGIGGRDSAPCRVDPHRRDEVRRDDVHYNRRDRDEDYRSDRRYTDSRDYPDPRQSRDRHRSDSPEPPEREARSNRYDEWERRDRQRQDARARPPRGPPAPQRDRENRQSAAPHPRGAPVARGGQQHASGGRELAEPPVDPALRDLDDDPRSGKACRQTTHGRKGRNTESFDPRTTFVRPAMRIRVGPNVQQYNKPLKHDDVIVVPEFFCGEDDWSIYYKLVEEMREAQADQKNKSEWLPWHEVLRQCIDVGFIRSIGCHLISKAPEHSSTFNEILRKAAEYFNIELKSVGTRFNWYRDDKDWKPFHHDSAAFNPQRARNQNITVGFSFGGERELAFIHAETGLRAYFPQSNGMMFSFGRDTNIKWKHGVNAVPESEYTGKGRISIVLWGKVKDVIEEDESPALVVNSRPGQGRGRGDGGRGGGRGGGRTGRR